MRLFTSRTYYSPKFLGIKLFKDFRHQENVKRKIRYYLKFFVYAVFILLIQLASLHVEHNQKEILSFEHYTFNYFIAWIGNVVVFYFAYKFFEWLYD